MLIIGGGPAGLTAGLYGGRARLKTLVVNEEDAIGGQMLQTERIENYPGIKSIKGDELALIMMEQAKAFATAFKNDRIVGIDRDRHLFVCTGEKDIYQGETVIFTTGAKPRRLGIRGEKRFIGRGVSYCAVCDAGFFENSVVAMIGSGDAALEESIYLARIATKVYILVLHHEGKVDGAPYLFRQAQMLDNIEFIWQSVPREIIGDRIVEGLTYLDRNSGRERKLQCQGIFIYVGTVPNTEVLRDKILLDAVGTIVTNDEGETSLAGLFAAGDCRKKFLRQVITAASDGANAAVAAEKYLLEERSFRREVLAQEQPVLVYFWHPHNENSMRCLGILEDIIQENKVNFMAVDRSKNNRIAERYRVQSIPSLLVFFKGRVGPRWEGEFTRAKINDFITREVFEGAGTFAR